MEGGKGRAFLVKVWWGQGGFITAAKGDRGEEEEEAEDGMCVFILLLPPCLIVALTRRGNVSAAGFFSSWGAYRAQLFTFFISPPAGSSGTQHLRV